MTAALADYAARKAQAQSLIERLSTALEAHQVKASQNPTNWGYAGDLGAFNSELINALDRVGGLTASEREQHRL
jgi:hypothetical protein